MIGPMVRHDWSQSGISFGAQGQFQIWADRNANGVYFPNPPNWATPQRFEDGVLFAATAAGEQFGLSSGGDGVFYGEFPLSEGAQRAAFGHGWVWLVTTARASTIPGYDLEWEGTLLSGCTKLPVNASTWGRIKAQYR